MKIELLVIGKTDQEYLKRGIAEYSGRLVHYAPFELAVLPDVKNTKNLTEAQQKEKEGKQLLEHFDSGDYVVLLDERGRKYTSLEFSSYINSRMLSGIKRLIFVIGGPYGFSDEVYARANEKISLSSMTFSHQMVRLIMVEQLYRAMTILRGEPYHHE